jgi:hypothetical protein
MPFIDATTAARLQESGVRAALLIELQFQSGTARLFNGHGRVAVDGQTWDGYGEFGSLTGLGQSRGTESSKVTLAMSGVSLDVIQKAKNGVDDVQGRRAFIWKRLFDADWQPVGSRIAIYWGIMQRINIRSEAPQDEAMGRTRVAELEIENPFAARSRPAARRFTDADQQSRWPGDKFFRFVPLQDGQTVKWP